jgi:hypothetical protein
LPAFSPAVVVLRRLSRRREPHQLLSTEISTASDAVRVSRDLTETPSRRGGLPLSRSRLRAGFLQSSGLYTGASSPSLLSSFLSALWAVGHVQASADAASSIIASASQVRIFHLGLSLQRLAKYSAAASALANATAAFLTSTGRGISRLSLAARERGSERLPRK